MKEIKPATMAPNKHREDVIDTLRLINREYRIFYALLLVFILTLAYENSALLGKYLFAASHNLPELGERKQVQLQAEMLDPLVSALAVASEDYPQYWARFASNQKRLAEAQDLVAPENGGTTPENSEAALAKVAEAVLSMQEFAAHPLVKPGKSLQKLEDEFKVFKRQFKLKMPDFCSVEPLSFKRESSTVGSTKRRNLFAYSLR